MAAAGVRRPRNACRATTTDRPVRTLIASARGISATAHVPSVTRSPTAASASSGAPTASGVATAAPAVRLVGPVAPPQSPVVRERTKLYWKRKEKSG
jgi:hypothetical protein